SPAASNLLLGSTGFRGTLLLTGTGANYTTDRGVTMSGLYPNGGAIGVDSPNTNLTWTGPILGTAFTKTGSATLTLTNPTSNYFAGTFVEAGTLVGGAAGAVIPANTDVTVFSGGTFKIGPGATNGSAIHTLTLNGGTLAAAPSNARYDL